MHRQTLLSPTLYVPLATFACGIFTTPTGSELCHVMNHVCHKMCLQLCAAPYVALYVIIQRTWVRGHLMVKLFVTTTVLTWRGVTVLVLR